RLLGEVVGGRGAGQRVTQGVDLGVLAAVEKGEAVRFERVRISVGVRRSSHRRSTCEADPSNHALNTNDEGFEGYRRAVNDTKTGLGRPSGATRLPVSALGSADPGSGPARSGIGPIPMTGGPRSSWTGTTVPRSATGRDGTVQGISTTLSTPGRSL